jgi:lipopolysaccharide export LptBFGC system permease protein LptF
MGSISQLRQLRGVYAGGVVAWTFCLLLNLVQRDGSARQLVLLLGLLAVFLVLLLWSAWCLREARAHRRVNRTARTANAHAESS